MCCGSYWRRLLIAGGVRVGSDVLYALLVVFSLTYVTTVLNLSRTLALTAIMVGAVVQRAHRSRSLACCPTASADGPCTERAR